jgi:hypothetical protein
LIRVGEAAAFNKWKVSDLLKAPTPQEIEQMKKDNILAAEAAKAGKK